MFFVCFFCLLFIVLGFFCFFWGGELSLTGRLELEGMKVDYIDCGLYTCLRAFLDR